MDSPEIRDVWASNLESEFILISELVERYPFVSFDAQFPGLIAKPQFSANEEERYLTQAININLTKAVQIGLTLGDGQGRLAAPACAWQFNFKFILSEDLHTPEAIAALQQAQYNFAKSESEGIETLDFAHLLLASGLVMNPDVVWICLQGGFGFAYLYRLLSGRPLPQRELDFHQLFNEFVPQFYDLKLIMFEEQQTMCGVQEMARTLQVRRYGLEKQSGSEALLNLMVFYKFMIAHCRGEMRQERYRNTLYGM
jgi:CCR4-NOT transcription complex subunit 7/8